MYPELEPEPVLKTLVTLWNISSETDDVANTSCSGGSSSSRNIKVLRPPSSPPPPPPCCDLEGLEFELETTSLSDKTITEGNADEFATSEEKGVADAAVMTDSLELNGHQTHDTNVTTNNYPYPDLVPEAFNNVTNRGVLASADNLHTNCSRSRPYDNDNGALMRNVESLFLLSIFCGTLLLLYLFPAHDPSTNY